MTGILRKSVKLHMLQSLLNFVSLNRMSFFPSLSLTSLTYCGVIMISYQRSAVISRFLLVSVTLDVFLRAKEAVRYRIQSLVAPPLL